MAAFPELKPRLSREARDGMNAMLKAMSDWRNEIAATNEKNSQRVIDKMSTAAAALGWPSHVVDAARTQLQGIAGTQAKALDQIMDAWEDQMKVSDQMTAPPSQLKVSPGLVPTGWPGAGDFPPAGNPLQLWLQVTEQWQKAWADLMTKAMEPGKRRDP